ncbi:MAG: hypothetical protein HN531_14250 [Opitutae bacterium]|jgi:hypothetical protein|nr:hypothetical protein [Opitutae bacterium]
MKTLSTITFSFFLLSSLATAKEDSPKNVFKHLIRPVLDAKCVQCHGADKDKGKLRMHTNEALLKGGREVGSDIVIKGKVDDSELIFRITLPKDEDEAMPPFEEKDHYNPVTPQELEVMKAWIKLGASFDLLVTDLDESSRKAADHVFKNMPKRILPSTSKLQPQLPVVPAADPKALAALRKAGVLALPIAQNTNAIYVNASYAGKSFDDKKLQLLNPLAKQLLWLNLARTGVTDKGIESLGKLTLLTRLHLENTSITDAASAHLSKLKGLEYLNLYGTGVSDASVGNLAKLRKLSKVFLWQTKFTEKGAESLKKSFVDVKKYNALKNAQDKMKAELEKAKSANADKISKLEKQKLEAGKQTTDKKAINAKCPVANKDLDESKVSTFEGRKIGFCCAKCKGKFDGNPASFKSKIKDFKPSEAFEKAVSDLNKAEDESDAKIGDVQEKLGKTSGELRKLGPEVNMGWKQPIAKKN